MSRLGTTSPFNITAEATTLGPFTEIELDLMIFWQAERHAIELKIRRDAETEAKALDQVAHYLDRAGLGEGWLVMFDLRKEVSWADKLFVHAVEHKGKQIRIVGG